MLRLLSVLDLWGAYELEEREFMERYREEDKRESESFVEELQEGGANEGPGAWGKVLAVRQSGRLTKWARAVKERDGYICQKCRRNKRLMYAHHRIPLARDLGKAFLLGNGKTLCLFCHMDEDISFRKRMLSNLYKTKDRSFDEDILRYIRERGRACVKPPPPPVFPERLN